MRRLASGVIWATLASGADFRGVLTDKVPTRTDRYNAVVLALNSRTAALAREIRGDLYYWIEVGRNPEFADAHPEWMASLQGHPEWRRFFPAAPAAGDGEVIKNYPWVPISYQETFAAHLARIRNLLADLPKPKGIFLNDLQGPPSACGCGNNLCRWTADYGPIRTATPEAKDAAARFVKAVKQIAGGVKVIPVWLTECEKEDKQERCANVGCFEGACWREWRAQFAPLSDVAGEIGVLAAHQLMGRGVEWDERLEHFRIPGAWWRLWTASKVWPPPSVPAWADGSKWPRDRSKAGLLRY